MQLKERRKMGESFSEPMKTIMSPSSKEKYCRKGSVSPSEEVSSFDAQRVHSYCVLSNCCTVGVWDVGTVGVKSTTSFV